MRLGAIVWVLGCCTFELPFEEPPTLCCSYFSASWGVRIHLYRKVLFICLTACVQGYLGDLELVQLSCLQVNQVAHHFMSSIPCIRVARTTAFQKELAQAGQIITLVSPPIHLTSPSTVTYRFRKFMPNKSNKRGNVI